MLRRKVTFISVISTKFDWRSIQIDSTNQDAHFKLIYQSEWINNPRDEENQTVGILSCLLRHMTRSWIHPTPRQDDPQTFVYFLTACCKRWSEKGKQICNKVFVVVVSRFSWRHQTTPLHKAGKTRCLEQLVENVVLSMNFVLVQLTVGGLRLLQSFSNMGNTKDPSSINQWLEQFQVLRVFLQWK